MAKYLYLPPGGGQVRGHLSVRLEDEKSISGRLIDAPLGTGELIFGDL